MDGLLSSGKIPIRRRDNLTALVSDSGRCPRMHLVTIDQDELSRFRVEIENA